MLISDTSLHYQRVVLLVLPYVVIQLLNGFYLPALSQSATGFWIYDISANAVLPVLIYFGLNKIKVSHQDYGFKKPYLLYDSAKMLEHSAGLLLMCWIIYQVGNYVVRFYPSEANFLYGSVIPSDGMLGLLAALYFSATAGVVESVVYLGIAKQLVDKEYVGLQGKVFFVLISTIIFAGVHWEQGFVRMFEAGVFQFVFSLAYLRIKYLPPFIVAHTAIDFLIFY